MEHIIGFRNGIYDLQENRFMYQLSMPIDYVEFNEDDQAVKDVHDFLVKVFPDQDIRNYFLDISSEVFVSGNNNHIYFWYGTGANGKSMAQLLFEHMLGPNGSMRLPTSFVGNKTPKAPKAPKVSPELARAGRGMRWATVQELDADDALNTSIMMQMTGNDTIVTRGLFEPPREIKPMFTLSIVCNQLPSIPTPSSSSSDEEEDNDVWNRVRVIPFESTFTEIENAPETWEEQMVQKRFPRDPHFAEKIPGMSQAFSWMLLNHRKNKHSQPSEAPHSVPEKVKLVTQMWREKNELKERV